MTQRGKPRRATELSRAALAAAVCCAAAACGLAQTAETPADDFRAALNVAGVTGEALDSFDQWNGTLTADQTGAAAQILFRLDQLADGVPAEHQLPRDAASKDDVGSLVEITGTATNIVAVPVPTEAGAALGASEIRRCDIRIVDGILISVLTPHLPKAWRDRAPGVPLAEPVRVRGVLLDFPPNKSASRMLVLTNRLQWYPRTGISRGVAFLAAHGFDAALLDEVRHGRPFARPYESREGQAFYACLTAVSRAPASELIELAREGVSNEAAAREKAIRSGNLSDVERALARQVAARGKKGVSSVWPLFNKPEESVGKLVLLEGIARRAIRIVATRDDSASPTAAAAYPDYYELDVFTPDSQNLPVICCVARLPDGFPAGEVIREPVRVAGVFFKKWAYLRRTAATSNTGDGLPERLAPPLVIAAEPQRLQPPIADNRARGWWGAAAVVAAALTLFIVLIRVTRRDRLARSARARYDAPFENLPGEPGA